MKYFKAVIYVSIFSFLCQGIANTDLSIISQLTHQHGNNWAGPLTTALLFIGSGLGSLNNKYIGKWKYKYLLVCGNFGYITYIAMGLVFMKLSFTGGSLTLILVGSLIGGLISSIFYNSLYNYVNVLARIDQRELKYFGILQAITQSCNIYGNVLSALLIQPLGQFNYVLIMDILIFVFGLFFLGLREPDSEDLSLLVQESNEETSINEEANIQAKEKLLGKKSTNWQPFKIAGCFAFTGLIIAFIYNTLSIILYRTFDDMDETQLNHLSFIVFIFEGVGEIIGGIAIIFLSPKIKSPAKAFIVLITIFMVGVGLVLLGSKLQSIYLICISAAICGICDCSCVSTGLSLAGEWKQKGITAYNLCQCLTVSISTMLMVFVETEWIMLIICVFYVLCVLNLWIHIKRTRSRQQKKEGIQTQTSK